MGPTPTPSPSVTDLQAQAQTELGNSGQPQTTDPQQAAKQAAAAAAAAKKQQAKIDREMLEFGGPSAALGGQTITGYQEVKPPGFIGPVNPTPKYEATDVMLQKFMTSDAHSVSQYQADFVKAGILEAGSYRVGMGDDKNTMDAFMAAIQVANQRGISFDDAIKYLQEHPLPGSTPEGKAAADRQAGEKAGFDAYRSELYRSYLQTWGINPPAGYIERAMQSHMNTYEFTAHERSKPAWMNSAAAQMERVNLNARIAQMTGRVKF